MDHCFLGSSPDGSLVPLFPPIHCPVCLTSLCPGPCRLPTIPPHSQQHHFDAVTKDLHMMLNLALAKDLNQKRANLGDFRFMIAFVKASST